MGRPGPALGFRGAGPRPSRGLYGSSVDNSTRRLRPLTTTSWRFLTALSAVSWSFGGVSLYSKGGIEGRTEIMTEPETFCFAGVLVEFQAISRVSDAFCTTQRRAYTNSWTGPTSAKMEVNCSSVTSLDKSSDGTRTREGGRTMGCWRRILFWSFEGGRGWGFRVDRAGRTGVVVCSSSSWRVV